MRLTNMLLTKIEEQMFALEELVRRLMNIRSANSSPKEAQEISELWDRYREVYNGIELQYKK